jgi:hypothetical protein
MSDPVARIELMERSLQCFVFGWLSLLPLLGLPFGIGAVAVYARVRFRASRERNPARRYLIWGLVLGLLGVVISALLACYINLRLYHAYIEGL